MLEKPIIIETNFRLAAAITGGTSGLISACPGALIEERRSRLARGRDGVERVEQ
jgi:hypothetical protein